MDPQLLELLKRYGGLQGLLRASDQGGPPNGSWLSNPHSMQAPNGQMIPRNFDSMVVPPYGLPPDRNSYLPDDIMRDRMMRMFRQERI